MQLHVLGFINHAHPPAAELSDDAVVRDGFADHWGRILRSGSGQVDEGGEVATSQMVN